MDPLALNVTVLPDIVVAGPKVAVMPAGKPEAASCTAASAPAMVTVQFAVEFALTVTAEGATATVNRSAVMLIPNLTLAEASPELPLIVA